MSVVIPSIGTAGAVHGVDRVFVLEAVRSVLATAGMPIEVIVVAGRSMSPKVADDLVAMSGDSPVRLVDFDQPFNFSAVVNLGAAHAAAELVLFLNDDTEVISSDWLTTMVAAFGPRVGLVGARLLFEDGSLQHAGHTYRTSLDHVGFGLPGDAAGRTGLLSVRRLVSGVTGACMLTSMDVMDVVGGFTPLHLPGNYNDVDFCLKVRYAGYDIVYEPRAVLHHFESKSRAGQVDIRPDEIAFVQGRWLTQLIDDPFTPYVV